MTAAPSTEMLGAIPDPKLDEDGCLLDEIACRRCGYALRGLRPSGDCPECTTPIRRSTKGDLLCFSDPEWVSTIARGGRVIVASIVLSILLPVLLLFWIRHTSNVLVLGAGMAIPQAVQIIGFWLATTPDPAMGEREYALSARVCARYGAFAAGVLSIAALLAGERSPSMLIRVVPGPAMPSPELQAAASMSMAVIMIGSIVALLRYARSLAWRLPDEKLWRQCNGVALGVVIVFSARAVADAWTILANASGGRASQFAPPSTVRGALMFASIICMGWCVGLIFRFRTRLNEASELSRETWRTPLLSARSRSSSMQSGSVFGDSQDA